MRSLLLMMMVTAAAASGCEDSEACEHWAIAVFVTSFLLFVCTGYYVLNYNKNNASRIYYATLSLCAVCIVLMCIMASHCLQNTDDKVFTAFIGVFFGGSALLLLTDGTFRFGAHRAAVLVGGSGPQGTSLHDRAVALRV